MLKETIFIQKKLGRNSGSTIQCVSAWTALHFSIYYSSIAKDYRLKNKWERNALFLSLFFFLLKMKITAEPKWVINNTLDLYKSPARAAKSDDFRSDLILHVLVWFFFQSLNSWRHFSTSVKRSWGVVVGGEALGSAESGGWFSRWFDVVIMHGTAHPQRACSNPQPGPSSKPVF